MRGRFRILALDVGDLEGHVDKRPCRVRTAPDAPHLAANVEAMLGATLRCRQAVTLPLLSRPASMRSTETVCRKPLRTSSSRVHCTLTGAPSSFERSAASMAKSHLDLRPKPPPSSGDVDGDILLRECQAFWRRPRAFRLRFAPVPDLRLVALDVRDCSRRLHGDMGEMRQIVLT